MLRALLLDRRPTVVAMKVCYALSSLGYSVDLFGETGSPAFLSRFCHRSVICPPFDKPEAVREVIKDLSERGEYDAIFLCSEEILDAILPLLYEGALPGLPLSATTALEVLLNKYSTLRFAQKAGVPVPKTMAPDGEEEVEAIARGFGHQLVVKGERGDSSRNVRLVTQGNKLLLAYREILQRESAYAGRPVLQEFISGPAYSVAGLFKDGRPLRICAHRKLLTYPPKGGWTVKGITERPVGLLDEAFKIFGALKYTGLGHAEFIRDVRDAKFKFVELNPRVWGSIGIAKHAGVDLYTPYQALANGAPVQMNLRFQEGVEYHRLSGELRLAMKRPLRLLGFLGDSFSSRVRSDFEWSDLGPQLFAASGLRWPYKLTTPHKPKADNSHYKHSL
jgi:predicted ATP-grasp superfamily ATP-dependent carboligase